MGNEQSQALQEKHKHNKRKASTSSQHAPRRSGSITSVTSQKTRQHRSGSQTALHRQNNKTRSSTSLAIPDQNRHGSSNTSIFAAPSTDKENQQPKKSSQEEIDDDPSEFNEVDELRLIQSNPSRRRPRISRIPRLSSIVEDKYNEEIHRKVKQEPTKGADKLSRNDRKRSLTQTIKKLPKNDEILQNPHSFTEQTYLNRKQLENLTSNPQIQDKQFEKYTKTMKANINRGVMGKTEKSIGVVNINFITNIGRLRDIYDIEKIANLDYTEKRIENISKRDRSSRGHLNNNEKGMSQYPMPGMDSSARLGGQWAQSKAVYNLLSEEEMIKGINAIKKSMTK